MNNRTSSRVLALVPGRGGSKGLPRKNVIALAGHPLIAWSVAAGLQARTVNRVVCSTDDSEIAEVAQRYGAEVPFMRPAELAGDDVPDLPVFQHALDWLEREDGWTADIVVQLRPTAPLRLPGQIDQAIDMLEKESRATGVRTVIPAPANPFKMWLLPSTPHEPWMTPLMRVAGMKEPFNMPRQSLPQAYWHTGTIDVVRADVIRAGSMSGSRLLPMIVDPRQAVDIDSELDLRVATERAHALEWVRPAAAPKAALL